MHALARACAPTLGFRSQLPAPPPRRLGDLGAHLLCVSRWWPTQVRVAVACALSLSMSSWTAHCSSLLTLTAVIFTPAAAVILWDGGKKNV